MGRWHYCLPPGARRQRTALVHVFPHWRKPGRRYTSSERRYVGLTLGSRLQRQSLCLPPGKRERRNASVLNFRWHKLERRYHNSERRYVAFGLTLGSTLEGWHYCLP